jgi:hypothetical protein
MTIRTNPYPRYLTDDCSGIQVLNMEHQIWAEGYQAGEKDGKAIKNVIKSQSDMVIVFNARGEQIPGYQGQYQDVRDSILRDASPETVFFHWPDYSEEPIIVSREDW